MNNDDNKKVLVNTGSICCAVFEPNYRISSFAAKCQFRIYEWWLCELPKMWT